MDTGTITPLLKRMEVSGLVTRVRDSSDERRVLVNLTTKAKELRDDIWSIADKIKSACQMTYAGLDELRRTLEALAHPLID